MRRDLHEAFVAQYVLQRQSYNTDPRNLSDQERAEWIRWNVLALTDELHEALNEVGWKPWATSRHLNRDAYKGELVDAFHFFINLCLVAEISADEIIESYFRKRERNAARQVNGYTGLNKCPGCRRAWDDIEASEKTYTAYRNQEGVTYCSTKCAEETASLS
jgi:dimeric dUTPase (all-alpha-NTP-PPase superfamily)